MKTKYALPMIPILLSGCTPDLQFGDAVDLSGGYRKSVIVSRDSNKTRIVSEKITYSFMDLDNTIHARDVDIHLEGDIGTTNVVLSDTENAVAQSEVNLNYIVKYSTFPHLWTSDADVRETVMVTDSAKIELLNAPRCTHIGDMFDVEYRYEPPPALISDNFIEPRVTITGANCIAQRTAINREHGLVTVGMHASCVGTSRIVAQVPGRPLILKSRASEIKIVPALAPPSDVNVAIGDVAEPEDPQPEPTPKQRNIMLHWQNSETSTAITLIIREKGKSNPVQQAFFQSGTTSFTTSLEVGKRYSIELRAEYKGCTSTGEWSKPFILTDVEIPA